MQKSYYHLKTQYKVKILFLKVRILRK